MTDEFSTKPLTAETWNDFVEVMGKQGGCYGCWCTHFRMPPHERKASSSEERKTYMKSLAEEGPPPGLVGYLGAKPVGWVQVTARKDVPRWNTPRTVSRPLNEQDCEDPACWAISCFFLQSPHRGKGLSHKLLNEAVEFARSQGGEVVEACPMVKAKHAKSVGLFVGPASIFRSFGFAEVAVRKDGRPLMRYALT